VEHSNYLIFKKMKTFRTLADFRAIPSEMDRVIEFVISSPAKDRHGTVLDINGWVLDSYAKNPIVGYQHNLYADNPLQEPNPDTVIGTARVWKENNLLIGAVTFEPGDINPLAEKIYQKVLHGSLRAASVGFLPLEPGHYGQGDESKTGRNPVYYYGRRELLEFSIVNIPSNSDAVRRAFEQRQLAELTEDHSHDAKLAALEIALKMNGIIPTEREKRLQASKKDVALFNIKLALAGVNLKNK
jgi:hypothetical protein